MNTKSIRLLLYSFVILAFVSIGGGSGDVRAQTAYAITENSVGAVRLGMTVGEARRAMRAYTFERSSDGEGIALIDVKRRGRTYMTVYAGEADPEKPIDDTARIEHIEVWNALFRTPKGVYPRMPVSRAARIYGPVREITMSEIESREYAKFANQPDYFTFRIEAPNATAGVYPRGQMKTTRAASNAYISSIVISARPGSGENTGGDVSASGFSSMFTDFDKDCRTPNGQGTDGGHISTFCRGFGEYRVHVFDTATTLEINAETDKEARIYHVATESLDYDFQKQKLEWRMANGKPFAVIFRANKYKTDANGLISYPRAVTGSHYVVKGLEGFEEIDFTVDAAGATDVSAQARAMADAAYLKKNPSPGGSTGGTTSGGGGNTAGGSSNRAFQNVDTNRINQTIDAAARRNNLWVKSPMEIVTRLTGEFSEMQNRTIELSSPTGNNAGEITVTVTNDGLMDDSVRSEKYVYKLEKTSRGVWKVTSAQKSWRCQPNRGHQDFSAAPCT